MTRLSFGEFRRALAARALIVRPDVLILDEFGHGLDTASRAAMEAALVGAAAAGTSLVVSTHRTRDVPPPITDELTIEGGTIARRGPYVRTQPVYRHAADVARHDAGDDARPAVIRLRGVDVYGDNEGEKILDGLNWTLRAGERWLVSGPNGAGKSTLAKLLYGRLRAAYGGNVERFGSGANHSVERIRSDVALISDDEQLRYDWSIPVEDVIASGFFQSVGLLRHPDDAQRSAAARLMHDFGIEHLLGRRFLELSFGERRMVLVARALVRVPQLLILDEALNGFDRRSRERIMRRVEQLAGAGTAVVFIGHDENDVPPWIDRELRLDAGRIASAGRRAALS